MKLNARETLLWVGPNAGDYRYVLSPETYSRLSDDKVVEEAALRSGVSKGVMKACWDAAGEVIKSWATEGHSVAIPGLGSMRFGVRAKSCASVSDVSTSLIKSRRVIFTPNTDIKDALNNTSISITCYDKNGNIVTATTDQSGSTTDDGDGDEYVG